MVSIIFALLAMLFIHKPEACSVGSSGAITANFKKTFTVTGATNDIVTLTKTSGPGSFTGISSLTGTITTGTTLNIDAYLTLPGEYVIGSVCTTDGTGTFSFNVKPAVFKILLSATKVDKDQLFSAEVKVYDYNDILDTLFLKAAYPVTISLTPSTTLSGTSSGSTSLGVFNPTNLKISTVGVYTVTATCTDAALTIVPPTESLTVIVFSSFGFATTETTADTYFDKTFTADMKDNSGNAYITPISVSISETSGSMVGVFAATSTISGTVSFTVYFTTSGTKSISFTSGAITTSLTVTVSKSLIEVVIESISVSPLDDSTDTFTLIATVKSSTGVTETTHGPHSIALALQATVLGNSGLVLKGYTSAANTVSGVAKFDSLSIASKGSFQVKATSLGLSDGSSSTYTINNHLKTIKVACTTTSITIYSYISIDVNLYGDDDKYYLNSESVTLTPATSSSIVNSLATKTTTIGYVSYTLYSTAIGSNDFTTSNIGSLSSNKLTIAFTAPVLKCVFENPATPSGTSNFDYKVTAYDTAGSTLLDLVNSVTLTLKVDCKTGETCSGSKFTPATPSLGFVNGIVKVSTVNFESSGIFDFKGSVTDWTSCTCTTGALTNSIKSYAVTVAATVDTYETFTATIALTGEDDNAFILPETVTITNSDPSKLSGTLSQSNSAGTVTFSGLYFIDSGTFTWTFSGSTYPLPAATGTTSITVSKSQIDLVFSAEPNDDKDTFSLTATIKDSSGNIITTSSYVLALAFELNTGSTLNSGSVITGFVSTMTTTSGTKTVGPMTITSSGDFKFTASYSGLTSDVVTCTILNSLSTLTISSGSYPTSSDLYTDITVTYKLTGSDGNDFLLASGFGFAIDQPSYATSTNTGLAYTLKGIKAGTIKFTASATNVASIDSTVIFTAPKFHINVSTPPLDSTTSFTITVKAYNTIDSLVLTGVNGVSAVLKISCSTDPCSGTKIDPAVPLIALTSGSGTSASVKIQSSGIFKLEVSLDDWTVASVITEFIENKVKTVTTTGVPAIFYTFFSNDVTLKLKGEDDQDYIRSATIVISDSTNTGLKGSLSSANSAGTASFTGVYYDKSGTYSWTLSGITFSASAPTIQGTVTKSTITLTCPGTAPTTSTSTFKLTATVSFPGIVDETVNIISIALSVEPSESVVTNLNVNNPASTTNNAVDFSNLVILSAGKSTFTAASTEVESGTIDFTITNKIKEVQIVTSPQPTQSELFTSFNVEYSVIGDDDQPYTESYTLSYTLDVTNCATISLVSNTYTITPLLPGDIKFTVKATDSVDSTNYKSLDLPLKFLAPVLKVTLNPASPGNSATSFTLTVTATKSDGTTTLTAVPSNLSITLAMACNASPCSGTITDKDSTLTPIVLTSGTYSLNSVHILSSGGFKFTASYTGWSESIASTGTITNKIKTTTMTSTVTNFYTYFYFDITITLKGEDDSDFILTTVVSFNDGGSGYLTGTTSDNSNKALRTFNSLYYTIAGSYTLTASSSIYALPSALTKAITVTQSILVITFIAAKPTLYSDTFEVVVTVKDVISGNTNVDNDHSITLAFAGVSDMSGSVINGLTTTTKSTGSTGIVTFSGLTILSSGTFKFTASATGFANADSQVTIANTVKKIELTTTLLNSYELFTVYTLAYNLIGSDDNDFILSTPTMAIAGESGFTFKIVSTNAETFTISSSTIGSAKITASTSPPTVTLDETMKFNAPKIIINLNPSTVADSDTPFTATIEIKSSDSATVLTGAPDTTIGVALACTTVGACSGTSLNNAFTSLFVTGGTKISASFKFQSSGPFTFTASYSDWTPGTATTSSITNKISSYTLTGSPNTYYTYFNFIPILSIKGEDSNPFLLATTITLSDGSSGKIVGTLTASNSAGTVTFGTMYYNDGVTGNSFTWSFTGSPYSMPADTETVTVIKTVIIPAFNPSAPTSSSDTFAIDIEVKSTTSQSGVLATDYSNSITIAYTPESGSIDNFSSQKTTSGGKVSLTTLSILSASDGYTFTFTSPGLADGTLSTTAVTTNINSITISNTQTNYNIYTNLVINFIVLGDDGENYPVDCTVTISADVTDSSVVLGTTSVTWSATSFFTVSKTTPGTVIYTLTSGSITNTLTIIYDPPKLKVELTPNPSDSSTPFNLLVKVLKSDGSATLTGVSGVSITLSISSAGSSGEVVKDSSGTAIVFPLSLAITSGVSASQNGWKILSSGVFTFTATYTGWTSGSITTNSVANKLVDLTVSNLGTIYTYFVFSATITLKGEDGNSYILLTQIKIANSDITVFVGTLEKSTSTGSATFSDFHYTNGGDFTWKITCDSSSYSEDYSISVTKSKMVIGLVAADGTINNSDDVLTATITVKDTAAGTTEASFAHTIKVSLTIVSSTSGTKLSGTDSGPTISGVLTLGNLKILSSGNFNFTATSIGLDPITVDVSIVNFVKTIALTTSATTIEMYTDFTITVTITGIDDNPYIQGDTITLVPVPAASATVVTNPQTNSDGTIDFVVYAILPKQSLSFTATASTSIVVSNSVSVSFNTPMLKITANPTPQSTSMTFTLTVGVYSQDGSVLLTEANGLVIVVEFLCNDGQTCSGVVMSTSIPSITTSANGQGVSASSTITSLGQFKFTASYTGITSSSKLVVDIISSISSMTVTIDSASIATFFDFSVTVKIYDANNNLFTVSTTIAVSDDSAAYLQGTKSITTSTGIAVFNAIYYEDAGTFILTATASAPYSFSKSSSSYTVAKSLIVLSIPDTAPTTSKTAFSLVINIENPNTAALEVVRSHACTITLQPDESLAYSGVKFTDASGATVTTRSETVTLGTKTLTSVKILSKGTFQIKAESSGLEDGLYSISPIDNFVKTITLTNPQTQQLTTYFTFLIHVNLLGDDDEWYLNTISVSMTCDKTTIGLPLSTIPMTHDSDFQTYATATGDYAFTASLTSNGVAMTKSITYSIVDPILKIAISAAPSTSDNSFDLTITARDSTLVTILDGLPDAAITLTFTVKTGETCSGAILTPLLSTFTLTLKAGTLSVNGLKILSSGTFVFTASATSFTTGTLEVGPITNKITSITTSLNPASTYYTFFDNTITVTLTGSDSLNFILTTTLTISSANGYLTTITEGNAGGSFSFSNKYFTNGGTDTITLSTNPYVFSKTVTLTITKSKISFNFKPSAPTTSSFEFGVDATVSDTVGGNTETKYTHSIVISIVATTTGNSGLVMSGTLTKDTVSGVATFTTLKVLSSGTFYLTGTSSGLDPVNTAPFQVSTSINSITLTTSPLSVELYTDYTITVALLGDDQAPYLASSEITLVPADPTTVTISTANPSTTTTGTTTFTMKSIKSGGTSFTAVVTGNILASNTITMIFLVPILRLSINGAVSTSDSAFTVTVKIYKSDNSAVNINANGVAITIAFACKSTGCSGTSLTPALPSITTAANGEGTSASEKIISSGTFTFISSCTGMTSSTAVDVTITSIKLIEIGLSLSAGPYYTFFNFDLSVTLKGEDGNNFLLTTSVTLSDDSSGQLAGLPLTYTNTNGLHTYSGFYYKMDGAPWTLTVASTTSPYALQNTKTITVVKSIISVSVNPSPTTSRTSFSLTASVLNILAGTAETLHNPHSIALTLEYDNTVANSGTKLVGYTAAQNTDATGVYAFTSLYFLSSGKFRLKVTSSGLVDAYTSYYPIDNFVKTITITSETTWSAYLKFTVVATLKGDDDNTFILSEKLTLPTSSNIVIDSSPLTTTTGTTTFTLYSILSGALSISITGTEKTSNTISVSIYKAKLEVLIPTPPILSTTSFSITVNAKTNDASATLLTLINSKTIGLTFTCQTGKTCSGNKLSPALGTLTLNAGTLNIAAELILSSGEFVFTATQADMVTGTLNVGPVTNLIKTMTPTLSVTTFYTYFDFNVNVKLYGEDDNYFILPAALTVTSALVSLTTLSATNSNGDITFSNKYFTVPGTDTLTFTTASPYSKTETIASIVIKASTIYFTLTPIPTDSKISFVTTATVKRDDTLAVESKYTHSIVISLTQVGTCSGSSLVTTLTQSTSSGVATFSSLYVLSKGTFTLSGTSSGLNAIATSQFTVKNYVKTITPSVQLTCEQYTQFTVTVNLYGDDDFTFIDTAEVTLLPNPSSSILFISSNKKTGTTGVFTFDVYGINGPSVAFTAAVTGSTVVSTSATVNLPTPKLKLTLSPTPTRTADFFSITAGIYDSTKTTLLPLATSLDITVAVTCLSSCSGTMYLHPDTPKITTSSSTSEGTVSNLLEWTVGNIQFTISRTAMTSDSITIDIATTILTITITPTSTVDDFYNYFDFSVNVHITYLVSNVETLFPLYTIITVTDSGSSQLVPASKTFTNDDGDYTFTGYYYNIANSYTLVTTTSDPYPYTINTPITIKKSIISLVLTPSPSDSRVPFEIAVTVLSKATGATESAHGPHLITLAIETDTALAYSGSVFTGYTTPQNTASGVYTFSNMLIKSSGTFRFRLTSPNLADGVTIYYLITNHVLTVNLVSSVTRITNYAEFKLTVSLIGDDSLTFILSQSTNINIPIGITDKSSPITITTGQADFTLYSTLSGVRSFTATSEGVTSSSKTITFDKPLLKVTLSSNPTKSTESFTFTVKAYATEDGTMTALANADNLEVIASMVCASGATCSGAVISPELTSLFLNDGTLTTATELILSSGTFLFTFASSDMVSITHTTGFITNLVKTITTVITDPKGIFTYFYLTISVDLYGEDNFHFILSTTLTITSTLQSLVTITASNTNNGIFSFTNKYFTVPGQDTLTLTTSSPYAKTSTEIVDVGKSIIKVEFIDDIIPEYSTDVFSILVSVYNVDGEDLQIDNSLAIPLVLENTDETNSGLKFIGYTLESTSGGLITYSGLQVLSSGNFIFKCSYSGLDTGSSSSFNIINYVKLISLSSPSSSLSAFEGFDVSIDLYGDDDEYFILTTTVTLLATRDYTISTDIETSNGKVSWTDLYVPLSGDIRFTGTTTSNSLEYTTEHLDYGVLQDHIILTLKDDSDSEFDPIDSYDKITVILDVYDNTEAKFLEHADAIVFDIEFVCSTDELCSGELLDISTFTESFVSGTYTFTDVYIKSSGFFTITISAPDMIDFVYNTEFILNHIAEITYEISTMKQSMNFDITLESTLYGDDTELYILPAVVSIRDLNNNVLSGDTSRSALESTTKHIFWCSFPSTYNIEISTNTSVIVTTISSLLIQPNTIRIIGPDPDPESNLTPFNIAVAIYDYDGIFIETQRGFYGIRLTLDPDAKLTIFGFLTKAGEGKIEDIRISEKGTFNLEASSTNLISSSVTLRVEHVLTAMTINTTDLLQNENTLFSLPVSLWDLYIEGDLSKSKLFNSKVTVNLTCPSNAFIFDDSIVTENGEVVFEMYFTKPSYYSCLLYTDFYMQEMTIEFKIDVRENSDPYCVVAKNTDICFMCIRNAIIGNDGSCECVKSSRYSDEEQVCQCLEEYENINGYCITCGSYFHNNELKGYYSDDYSSVYVEYKRQVKQSSENSCSKMVNIPFPYNTIKLDCVWVNSQLMKITPKTMIVDNIDIIVNPLIINPVEDACLLDIEALVVPIKATIAKPKPQAVIEGLPTISISCLPESVKYTSLYISDSYTYSWSAKTDPKNDKLEEYVKNSQSSFVTFPESYITTGKVELKLKIKDKNFDTSSSTILDIRIIEDKYIPIIIATEGKISITSTETYTLKITVLNRCGETEAFNYNWYLTYDSETPEVNFTTLKSFTKRSDNFIIYPGYLKGGYSYYFSASVASKKLDGSASVEVYVKENDLQLTVDTGNSVVGVDYDLEINAKAYDIDNSEAKISYTWSCSEGSKKCYNSNGEVLELNNDKGLMIVKKENLRDGAMYTFEVKASASKKKVTREIEITVNATTEGYIKLTWPQEFINNDVETSIIPKIKGVDNTDFLWKIEPHGTTGKTVALTKPYLTIPADYLNIDIQYKISLSMTQNNITSSAYLFLYRNSPPTCDSLSVLKQSDSIYLLTGTNCRDENSNGVIKYQYAAGKSLTDLHWISVAMLTTPFSARVSSGTTIFMISVCDESYTCSNVTTRLTNPSQRQLSLIEDFDSYIYQSDLIPSAILSFTKSVSSTSEYKKIYKAFNMYYTTEVIDKQCFKAFLDNLYVLMSVSDDYSSSYKASAVKLILYVLQSYKGYLDQQDALKLLNIMKDLIDYSDRTTTLEILDLTLEKWFADKLIGSSVYFNKKIGVFRTKLLGSSLYSLEIERSLFNLAFPDTLDVENTTIYDISLTRYESDENIFEITLYESGTYENYNLILKDPVKAKISYPEPIILSLDGSFDEYYNYDCFYLKSNNWTSGVCQVEDVSETRVEVKLSHLSTFKVVKASPRCGLGQGPITAMCLLAFLMIVFVTTFCIIDRGKLKDVRRRPFCITYPLASVFIKQEFPRRAYITMHLFTTWLVLLCLIGAFMNVFDSPTDGTNESAKDYYGYQLSRGAAAWALAQLYVIPSLYLMYHPLKDFRKTYLYTFSMLNSVFMACISILGIILMTIYYCMGWTDMWIITFLVFIPIDLAAQLIYSLIIGKLILKEPSYERISQTPRATAKEVVPHEIVQTVADGSHAGIVVRTKIESTTIKIRNALEKEAEKWNEANEGNEGNEPEEEGSGKIPSDDNIISGNIVYNENPQIEENKSNKPDKDGKNNEMDRLAEIERQKAEAKKRLEMIRDEGKNKKDEKFKEIKAHEETERQEDKKLMMEQEKLEEMERKAIGDPGRMSVNKSEPEYRYDSDPNH